MKRLRNCIVGGVSVALLAPLVIGSGNATEPPVVQGTGAGFSGGIAGGTIADIGVVCDEVGNPANCQLPDQLGHGAGGIIGATSDASATVPYAVSERIANESGTTRSLTQVCWWGFYLDFAATPQADCGDDPAILTESFDITIYYNTSDYVTGCPTSVPGGVYKSFPGIAFQKAATGNIVEAGGGTIFLDEYEYTATLAPAVSLRPNTCYWIEIQNDTTGTVSDSCVWLWQTAPPGDNASAQDSNGDGIYIQSEVNDFDMAICLDVPLGDTSICDPVINDLCIDAPESCALAHATPGCDDPCCCTVVCDIDPSCCDTAWVQDCADLAISEGCALLGYPVCIATGPDNAAAGYLKICSDPYGSWSDDASYGAGADDPNWGDEFLPAGSTLQAPTFTVGFYVFMADTHRELLTTNDEWKLNITGGPMDDDSLVSAYAGVTSLEYDDNADGVSDRLESSFTVIGAGVNLAIDLTQKVTTGGSLPAGVSVMTQTLVIDNLGPAISFELLRHLDGDLPWDGAANFYFNDSPGTGTNASPLDRHIYQHEVGSEAQSITISSDHGGQYYGCINTHDPDDAGPIVAMGYGTDTQNWEAYGVPAGWENYIAFVGYDTDGETGDQNNDGSIGLEIPVTIGAGGSETVIVQTTYGATTPEGGGGEPPCPCDCEDPPDGTVDVGDFLALLAQWGGPGTCDCEDPPDGAVDVGDFLALLATWGPCP